MAFPPWNLDRLITRPDGWLKAGTKLGSRRRPHGARCGRGRAAEALFGSLRRAVISGRWEEIYGMLSARVRAKLTPEKLLGHLRRNAPMLRRAYRDAEVTSVSVSGERARLELNWGRAGFALHALELVEERGSWRFDTLPWTTKLILRDWGTRAGEASAYVAARGAESRARRRPGKLHWLLGGALALAVPCLVTFFAIFCHSWLIAAPLTLIFIGGPVLGLVLSYAGILSRSRRSGRARERR
jgi:hypothetical protein